jgi:hypothetical protein
MAWNRSRSAGLDERRRHAEAFVRSLPPAPEYGPLTDEERAGIEAAVRRYPVQRGDRWHGRVLWARSPAEFRKLCRGRERLPLRRGDRVAHRFSVGSTVVLRAVQVLLCVSCFLGALAALEWAVVLYWLIGDDLNTVSTGWILAGFVPAWTLSILLLLLGGSLASRWRRSMPQWRARPLCVRMPRGLRPGTPEFRAWLPRELLGGVERGPDGRVVLSMVGCAASSMQDGEFLGGHCGRSADLYPVRFRELPGRGRRQAFDGHLRPHELAWLLDRREVAPRRFARTLLHARAQVERAFAVRVFRDVAVVLEPPIRFRTERLPDGTSRVHCDDGPAVEWASGDRTYALHGVAVPKDLVEQGWGVPQIDAARSSEVRRVAIERLGWATYLERAGLEPVATAPDPANGDRSLRLYAIPELAARVLLMANGSPDRSGGMRQYAELVPSSPDDPVAAAAWQYGVPVDIYSQLQRRT